MIKRYASPHIFNGSKDIDKTADRMNVMRTANITLIFL
jgi:hypothetical protein